MLRYALAIYLNVINKMIKFTLRISSEIASDIECCKQCSEHGEPIYVYEIANPTHLCKIFN